MGFSSPYKKPQGSRGQIPELDSTCSISEEHSKMLCLFADILRDGKTGKQTKVITKGSQCRPSHLHIVHRTLLFMCEPWSVQSQLLAVKGQTVALVSFLWPFFPSQTKSLLSPIEGSTATQEDLGLGNSHSFEKTLQMTTKNLYLKHGSRD